MAKVVDTVLKSRALYPWDVWCDGQIWELKQGEDFTCTLQGMCAAVYGRGQSLGVKVVVSQNSERKTVTFQFNPPSAKDEKKKVVKKAAPQKSK